MRRAPFKDMQTMNALFPDAENIAQQMGDSEPGAEHLVLAAMDLPEGSARRAFERAGADPDAFYAAVERQHADALDSIGVEVDDDAIASSIPDPQPTKGLLRSAPSSRKVFKQVVKKIRKEKAPLIGAYIVLVAAESDHGTVARALRAMGVEPGELVAGARAEIDALSAAD